MSGPDSCFRTGREYVFLITSGIAVKWRTKVKFLRLAGRIRELRTSTGEMAKWPKKREINRVDMAEQIARGEAMEDNAAPRMQLFASPATRRESIDDPLASAVIESLRFELENSQQMVMHLQQELRKAEE